METMTRFKMDNLDKMGAELATTILALHVTDVFKESCGGLDELTKGLFNLQIPTIKIKRFHYYTNPDRILEVISDSKKTTNYLEVTIPILYPGVLNPSFIRVELFHSRGYWMIRYSPSFDGVEKTFKTIEPNVIATPLLRTNAWSDISLSSKLTEGIEPHRIFINFMETLFLDIILGSNKEYFMVEPRLHLGLSFVGEKLINFLVKFQNRLLSGR